MGIMDLTGLHQSDEPKNTDKLDPIAKALAKAYVNELMLVLLMTRLSKDGNEVVQELIANMEEFAKQDDHSEHKIVTSELLAFIENYERFGGIKKG